MTSCSQVWKAANSDKNTEMLTFWLWLEYRVGLKLGLVHMYNEFKFSNKNAVVPVIRFDIHCCFLKLIKNNILS